MFGFAGRLYRRLMESRRQRYIERLVRRGLKLGRNVEIIETFFFDPSHCFLISIGDNCTFAPNVRLIAHDASSKKLLGYTKLGKITIEDNCFLGDSVIVLPGVTIGRNSIVGAGSIVTRSIPADSVAAGNPARVMCTVQEYTAKVRRLSEGKQIFGYDYYIDLLNDEKRAELAASVGSGTGFIV